MAQTVRSCEKRGEGRGRRKVRGRKVRGKREGEEGREEGRGGEGEEEGGREEKERKWERKKKGERRVKKERNEIERRNRIDETTPVDLACDTFRAWLADGELTAQIDEFRTIDQKLCTIDLQYAAPADAAAIHRLDCDVGLVASHQTSAHVDVEDVKVVVRLRRVHLGLEPLKVVALHPTLEPLGHRFMERPGPDPAQERASDPVRLHHAILKPVVDPVGPGDQPQIGEGALESPTQLDQALVRTSFGNVREECLVIVRPQ